MEIVLPYLFGLLVAAILLRALWPKRRQRTRYSAHAVAQEVEGRLYDEHPGQEHDTRRPPHSDLAETTGLEDDDVWEWPDLDDWDEGDSARRRKNAA